MQSDPRYYVRVAIEALQGRDRAATADAIAHLIRSRAPIGTTWGPIARMARSLGESDLAVAAQKNHIAENPSDLTRSYELALIYIEAGRIDNAIEIGQTLVDRAPGEAAFHQVLGSVYAQAGKSDAAIEALRRGLSLSPLASETWLALVQQKKFTVGDPDLDLLQRAIRDKPLLPKGSRGTLYYALGKALDDIGHDDRAFAAYQKGAELVGADAPYNRAGSEAFVAKTIAQCTPDFFAKLAPSRETSDRIVFVLGIPRSGTTLTEQIFVSHSAVSEGAEAGMFHKAALALPNFDPDTIVSVAAEPRWRGDLWTSIARAYLHLMTVRFGGEGRLVDKTLSHTRYLGTIAHTLPNAKFIWVRREPGAVAWSCFKTCFAKGLEWSWSLADIGHHFRLEDQLYAHWTSVLPDRILTVPYEQLVADPDTWIPKMLAFAGLSDEPQTRNFHQVERVVRTASISQVRRPLYTSSVTGWRRYEEQMRPFFDTYRAA